MSKIENSEELRGQTSPMNEGCALSWIVFDQASKRSSLGISFVSSHQSFHCNFLQKSTQLHSGVSSGVAFSSANSGQVHKNLKGSPKQLNLAFVKRSWWTCLILNKWLQTMPMIIDESQRSAENKLSSQQIASRKTKIWLHLRLLSALRTLWLERAEL